MHRANAKGWRGTCLHMSGEGGPLCAECERNRGISVRAWYRDGKYCLGLPPSPSPPRSATGRPVRTRRHRTPPAAPEAGDRNPSRQQRKYASTESTDRPKIKSAMELLARHAPASAGAALPRLLRGDKRWRESSTSSRRSVTSGGARAIQGLVQVLSPHEQDTQIVAEELAATLERRASSVAHGRTRASASLRAAAGVGAAAAAGVPVPGGPVIPPSFAKKLQKCKGKARRPASSMQQRQEK